MKDGPFKTLSNNLSPHASRIHQGETFMTTAVWTQDAGDSASIGSRQYGVRIAQYGPLGLLKCPERRPH
jgi:hypothetical protein